MSVLRVLSLVVAVVLVAGCVAIPRVGGTLRGSGRAVTEEYEFADFTRVQAGSAFEVEITRSDSYSVAVTVDDNVVEHLEVTKSGDTLHIGLEPLLGLGLNNVTLKAKVSLPTLEGLDLSGATRTTISGFTSEEHLDVEVSGASTLRGDVAAGDARVKASGASTVRLEGQAQDLDVEASGASTVDLEPFPSADVRADASGASRIVVNVSGRLDASASGASSVRYVGEPISVSEDASGASSIGRR